LSSNYPLWRPAKPEQNDYLRQSDVIGRSFSLGRIGLVTKSADSSVVGPLIRQDLDPTIYKLFVKKFPLFDMIEKIPSNGLVHAYNQATSFGDALFQTEDGTVTDDNTVYNRATANIAVLATRRGVTLKAQYAVRQGGAPYDAEAEELANGITALRHKLQAAMLRIQSTVNTAVTDTDPNGLYDPNAFNGLRYMANANIIPATNQATVNVSAPYAGTLITNAVKSVSDAIIDAGGEPSLVFGGTQACRLLDEEQIQFVRYLADRGTEVIPGLHVKNIDAGQALLPLLRIPGDGVGTWVNGSHNCVDLFVADMNALKLAYLGGPTPTVLDIPIGVDGKLQKLMIPFMMAGLVVTAPSWVGRVTLQLT
jgi:hypothetical protein